MRSIRLLPVFFVAVLTACNDDAPPAQHDVHVTSSAPATFEHVEADIALTKRSPMVRRAELQQGAPGHESPMIERRIEEVQHWRFEVPAAQLEQAWNSPQALCTGSFSADCEVMQATISNRSAGHGAQHGHLELRVGRHALEPFLTALTQSGVAPTEKNISRTDLTLQWVDLQARKANAQQLRDRLQSMLAQEHKTPRLPDLLALERELNRVQSSLDSMESQIRVMAGKTEKVRLNFQYTSAPDTVADDVWRPIKYAWHQLGQRFTHNLGQVMLFLAGLIPWLVVLVPAWFGGKWMLRRFIARRRARR